MEFAILFFWTLLRAFTGPFSANRSLRVSQILRAIPYGFYSIAIFLASRPDTLKFALWTFLLGVIFYWTVSRPYLKRLVRRVQENER